MSKYNNNGVQEMSFIDDFCYSDIENPLFETPIRGTKRKIGAPVIPFSEASPKAKKRKLDPPFKNLLQTCIEHSIPFDIALGHMGARYYHGNNSQLEELFKW